MKATEEQKRTLRMYLDSLKRVPVNGAASHDGALMEWREPVSLAPPAPPILPLSIFPEPLAAMIKAVATETETPLELGAVNGLGVVSAAIQGKFVIEPKAGYREPLNIWLGAYADSGERKTVTQRRMTHPLIRYEADELERMCPLLALDRSDRKTLEGRINFMRSQLAKMDPLASPQYETRKAQLSNAAIAFEGREILREPRVFTEDITPERLGSMMFEQHERMAIITDEAGIFGIMAGRYSGGVPNLDIFLKSFSGSPVRVDRQARPSVIMDHPLLTMVVSPQTGIIPTLRETKDFRHRGLLARFCVFLPPSKLGERTGETPSVAPEIAAAYDHMVRALLDIPQPKEAAVLKLSDEAHADWREFSQLVECELRPGGKFENIKDWGARAPGLAARIAGILHCVACAADEVPPTARAVDRDVMKSALDFTAVAVEHALVFFDAMGADAALDGARKVWRWIERERKPTFKFKDCFDALKGTFGRTDELEPAFEVLVEREHILLMPDEPHVGRPSRIYAVNPKLVAAWEAH